MTDKELLELAELRKALDYNQETGIFTWLYSNSNSRKAGRYAGGSLNSHGYLQIQVNKKLYRAHRLAWFYVYGEWPDQIDHINGVRSDNRISNLRSVSVQLNNHNQRKAHSNNVTGVLGVVAKPSGKFSAEIRVNGKKKYLGTFCTKEDASEAYLIAKKEWHQGAML